MNLISRTTIKLPLTFAIAALSCVPKTSPNLDKQPATALSSVTMPIPENLKPHVSAGKIDSYSLSIAAGTCETSAQGTNIQRAFSKLAPNDNLANERIKRGCSYTIVLSLGKSDASGNKLEKTYLTNNIEGKQTQISQADSKADKVRAVVQLIVTDEGKKDLGIIPPTVPVPSSGEIDATISIKIPGNDPATDPGDYDWRKEAKWAEVKSYSFSGQSFGSDYYKDIMEHTTPSERFKNSAKSTEAHESLHGLLATMRNASREKDGFLYFEKGQGIYVPTPTMTLDRVRPWIGPDFQRATIRFQTYLIEAAKSWQDPLYLFDEWNAYIATTRTAVEMSKAGQWDQGNSDPLDGVGDFVYFGSAVVAALKEHDPSYTKNNPAFKVGFAMLAEQSMQWASAGLTFWPNSKATQRFKALREDAENEKIRAAVRELMGTAWTKRVLGF